jgi:hypothetical protein
MKSTRLVEEKILPSNVGCPARAGGAILESEAAIGFVRRKFYQETRPWAMIFRAMAGGWVLVAGQAIR